ncbi:MAG: class I SAM-dependent methyltransferase, partial [Planctomycetia bacterium]
MVAPRLLTREHAALMDWVPLDSQLVVEIGCGDGARAAYFRSFHPFVRYVGVENHPEAVKRAAGRLDRLVVDDPSQATAESLAVAPGTVDCLVYANALERMADPVAVLRRQAEWLKPDGVVVAGVLNAASIQRLIAGATPAAADPDDAFEESLRPYPLRRLRRIFEAAGLTIERVTYVGEDGGLSARTREPLASLAAAVGVDAEQFVRNAETTEFVVQAVKS